MEFYLKLFLFGGFGDKENLEILKIHLKIHSISDEITNLVHAACKLLIVIIDLSFGFVPNNGSPHVKHLD